MPQDAPNHKRELVEAMLSAINSRDFDSLAELLDPEIEFRSVLGAADGEEVYTGMDGIRKWADNVDATWEDYQLELVDFRDAGDEQAVAVFRWTGRAKSSGVPLDTLTGQVLTWRDGKGSRNVVYSHPREAFEAVGLEQ